MKHHKRMILICLAFFVFSLSFTGYADIPRTLKSNKVALWGERNSQSEELTFIVELEGEPVYSENRVSFFGEAPSEEENAQLEDMIEEYQQEILYEISENADAEHINSYSLLFNGFSMRGSYESIEEIKKIPGVENVYICDDIKLTTHLAESVEISGALPESVSSYSGKGQVVAVIDNGFNVDHEFFKAIPSDAQYSKEDIINRVPQTHAKAWGDAVYKSEKIPFAYDYYYDANNTDKGDCNVLPGSHSENNHGTHVAGIVGGKNGDYNGKKINGVAPDCQLLLMKIASDDGSKMPLEKLIEAMEDAVALGADVINCSIGVDYLSAGIVSVVDEVFANAHNAGVFVAAASGNKGKGFNMKTPLTDNIDYSASGVPAVYSGTVSVGSATKDASGKMRNDSSYGVSENLELKPDITAPGNEILSSVKDGTYGALSGTSMASPHIAGAAAIVSEYLENENITPLINKADFIQNLLMSTAKPIGEGQNLYSPRVQGAGMVNLGAAVKTKTVLTGNEGKSKISLGDELTDEINFSFNAENFGNNDIIYDKLSLTVLTDSYTGSNGKYDVGSSMLLEVNSDALPNEISILANSSAEIDVNIKLDKEKLNKLSNVFTNGFFIDGFIRLENSQDTTICPVGIPFTGFYGDWTKAPVFDKTMYDDGGSTIYDAANKVLGTFAYKTVPGSVSQLILGLDGDESYKKEYIAIAPGDKIGMAVTPMRTISKSVSQIIDKDGKVVSEITDNTKKSKLFTEPVSPNNTDNLPDGEYRLKLTSYLDYDKETPTEHNIEVPFYVDSVEPEITGVTVDGDTVKVKCKDNMHVAMAYYLYIDQNGFLQYGEPERTIDVKMGEEREISVDISKVNLPYEDIFIMVEDKAGNAHINSISCLTGEIHPMHTATGIADNKLIFYFDIMSYKSAKDISAMLGLYDNSGCLVYLKTMENIDIIKGASELNFEISEKITGVRKLKLFFWNNSEDIIPVDTSKVISATID